MSIWYRKVCKDLANLPDCIDYFEQEYAEAQKTLSLRGKSIERHGSELPGIVEHRFGQLQEIEAILEYLNIELKKKKTAVFRKYL
jgi:hypothetical protein